MREQLANERAAIVEEPHPGYRLAWWDGTVPDELAETFAQSRRAMDDMPMGGTDYGTVHWAADRVPAAVAGRGEKAAAILHAGDRHPHPHLAGLLTDTAEANLPMRAINDALGYTPTHQTSEYQLDLAPHRPTGQHVTASGSQP